jgi:hypothetical protein
MFLSKTFLMNASFLTRLLHHLFSKNQFIPAIDQFLPQLIILGHCLLSLRLGGHDESLLFFILGVGPAHGRRHFFTLCLPPLGFLLGLPLGRGLGLS